MKKYILVLFSATLLLNSGCKKYLDVNKDPNNPTDVDEALILAPVEQTISDNLYGGMGSSGALAIQNYIQAIAPNQPNPGVWNYQLFNVDLDGDWYYTYVATLTNLRAMNTKAEADGKSNYAGIAKVLTAYSLGIATDMWGDIPYSQGFQGIGNLHPTYDSQEDIYKTIQSLLDAGIADFAKNSAVLPSGDDFFYTGDMGKWTRLAYTLKARYYMHLVKAPGYTAAGQSDSALLALSNGMTSASDDLTFAYAGNAGSENSWYLTFGAVSTYVLNSTFIDTLKVRNDPRLYRMAKVSASDSVYRGRMIGSAIGSLDDYSYPSDAIAGEGAKNYIVPYVEALFIKAEATFRKSGAAAAQPIFQDGITKHMVRLGIAQDSINTYLAARGTLTANNGIQRIMEEKNIANFLNPENFTDWRRTGFPVITKVTGALSDIPRRLLYPESEILSNKQSQQSAVLTDRLWFDAQ